MFHCPTYVSLLTSPDQTDNTVREGKNQTMVKAQSYLVAQHRLLVSDWWHVMCRKPIFSMPINNWLHRTMSSTNYCWGWLVRFKVQEFNPHVWRGRAHTWPAWPETWSLCFCSFSCWCPGGARGLIALNCKLLNVQFSLQVWLLSWLEIRWWESN
jgi:hypothetical protein